MKKLSRTTLLPGKALMSRLGLAACVGLLAVLVACGEDEKCKFGGCEKGDDTQGGIKAKADLTGAFGLLVVDNSENQQLKLMEQHNETVEKLGLDAPTFKYSSEAAYGLSDSSEGSYQLGDSEFSFPATNNKLQLSEGETSGDGAYLQKIDKETGEISDALTQVKEQNTNAFDPNQKLPKIKTIAVAPTGEVYLEFERSFIYRDAPRNEDPWNPSSGYQCQIFKIGGGTFVDLLVNSPERENLVCVDNMHFIDTWRTFDNGVFQFDSAGNLYYPGSIPNVNKTVVYRMSRDGSESSEIINANICVNNFLITPAGGTFYTGQTCQQGNNGGGNGDGGFFRYIAPGANGSIVEIARNWWNFIYDTSVTAKNTDTAVFFGPDPRTANTASWNTACLFQFNPEGSEVNDRISEVITCGNNIWDWMELRRPVDIATYGNGYNNGPGGSSTPTQAWKEEYARRCTTKDEVFAGGGSQISAVEQASNGDIYVIGNIRKKAEGEVKCSVVFRGPHCTISGVPVLKDEDGAAYTQTSCTADSGTWVNKGNCSNGTNKAEGCIDHARSWTAGFCSNNDYTTKAACEAASGCSNKNFTNQSDCTSNNYTWHPATNASNGLVWRTGHCSSDPDRYETEAACTAAGKTWRADTWSGSCTSTDTSDNASLWNNDRNSCIPNWQTEQVWYSGVTGDICKAADTGNRSTFWEWNSKDNNFTQTADSTHSVYADLTGKYLVDRMECQQVGNGTGNSGEWTTEYAALAKVNTSKKTLELLSLPTEKAINLWLVADTPYYSSFDTQAGKYLLNGLVAENACVDTDITQESSCTADNTDWSDRRCVMTTIETEAACKTAGYTWQTIHASTILTNFETYNLAEALEPWELFADGLDFTTNQYKFGIINPEEKTLKLRTGLTGTVKTIVILPKN